MRLTETVRNNLLLTVGGTILAVVGIGAAVWPSLVYDRFIWPYFWGPIVADAANQTVFHNGIPAVKGYTLVNEIGYGLLLGYLLLLLVTVLKQFNVGKDRTFALAFIPFIVSGGVLRVLEDAATGLGTPLQYLLISPLIYFTMFGIVFSVLLGSLLLERRQLLADYRYGVVGAGTGFTVLVLIALAQHTTVTAAWMLPATVGGAALLLAGTALVAMYIPAPYRSRLASVTGLTILFGHLLDAVSTALSIDLLGYGEKHPVVDHLITVSGTPYAFIPVKLLVISSILLLINDETWEDDPVFTNLVILGILSIGLGPGVRNMTRAVLGI